MIGRLSDRVALQQRTASGDTQGGRAYTWSTLATVWAAVRPWPRAGGEQLQASAVRATQQYEVEIRYRADVTPQMRLSWTPYGGSAKTLQILEVGARDGRRERLVLQCAEGV